MKAVEVAPGHTDTPINPIVGNLFSATLCEIFDSVQAGLCRRLRLDSRPTHWTIAATNFVSMPREKNNAHSCWLASTWLEIFAFCHRLHAKVLTVFGICCMFFVAWCWVCTTSNRQMKCLFSVYGRRPFPFWQLCIQLQTENLCFFKQKLDCLWSSNSKLQIPNLVVVGCFYYWQVLCDISFWKCVDDKGWDEYLRG